MADLAVVIVRVDVDQGRGGVVEVDRRIGVGLALGGDILESPILAGTPVDGRRHALHHGVVDIAHRAADVVPAVQRRLGRGQRVDRQHLRATHAGTVIHPVQAELDVEIILREPAQGQARGLDVLVADIFARTIDDLAEAVALHAGDRQTCAQAAVTAADRTTDRRLDVTLAVVAHAHRSEALKVLGQRFGDVLDRATDRVLAIQGALRTAKDFDAIDIEHIQQRTLRTRDVHVVEVDADARIHAPQRIGLADAADVGRHRAGRTARRVDGQVGHLRIQVTQVLYVQLVERFRGERGHRDRHFLDRKSVV